MSDPATAEDEKKAKEESAAQTRIKELDRRNKELERLVNMKQRLERAESTADQALAMQNRAGKTKEEAPDPNNWKGFLGPKVDPLLEEKLAPIRGAILRLADENDRLTTMLGNEKYKTDPELQAEVEQIRQDRLRQTGQLEPRNNVLTYMKGTDPKRFEENNTKEERREDIAGATVETTAGVGGSRAEAQKGSGLTENSSLEEFEKWFEQHPEDAKLA